MEKWFVRKTRQLLLLDAVIIDAFTEGSACLFIHENLFELMQAEGVDSGNVGVKRYNPTVTWHKSYILERNLWAQITWRTFFHTEK